MKIAIILSTVLSFLAVQANAAMSEAEYQAMMQKASALAKAELAKPKIDTAKYDAAARAFENIATDVKPVSELESGYYAGTGYSPDLPDGMTYNMVLHVATIVGDGMYARYHNTLNTKKLPLVKSVKAAEAALSDSPLEHVRRYDYMFASEFPGSMATKKVEIRNDGKNVYFRLTVTRNDPKDNLPFLLCGKLKKIK